MYFKRLEIFGFKSFAERTVLNFEPGITAIVGPNGCGKSNVFDSIRWVLGEQSSKQMRGSSMEDVIFNGTDTKLALGFAEVSVTFDNSDRALSIDRDEVIVTRRLFRSGESEYLINKQASRLKDITEMFMGTGVGAEAYSLIQQGKVDLVVSAKPDDRRAIFDEAAGITKYKAKKREAQNKLKDTNDNLLRLNDIIVEVKRQIASVERQAKKAERYKDEFEKLKDLERIFAIYQLEKVDQEKGGISQFLADLKSKEESFTAELEEFRQVLERESLLSEDLELKVREAREESLKMESQIELNQRQIGFNEERIQNIADNEVRVSEKKKAISEKCQEQQSKISELQERLASFTKEVEAGIHGLAQKKTVLDEVAGFISENRRLMEEDERAVLTLSSRQVEIRNQLTEIMKETQGTLARQRHLKVEEEKVQSEKLEAQTRLESLGSQMIELVAKRDALANRLTFEKQELSRQQELLQQIQTSTERLERKKIFLISQKEFIEKLKTEYQEMPDTVVTGRFFSTVAPQAGQRGFIGKVTHVLPVDGARLEAIKVQINQPEATALYEIVCETKYVELDPQILAEQISQIEVELTVLYRDGEAKNADVKGCQAAIESVQADLHHEEKRLSVQEAQKKDIADAVQKIFNELETITLETQKVEEALVLFKEQDQSLAFELKQAEEKVASAQEGVRSRQQMLSGKQHEHQEAAIAVAQAETEMGALRERENSWKENLAMFQREFDGAIEEGRGLEKEASTFDTRRQDYYSEIERLEEESRSKHQERETLRENLARYVTEEEDVSQRLNSVQAQISSMEKEKADGRDLLHERDLKLQSLSFQEQSIIERMQQRYQIDILQVREEAKNAPLAALESRPATDEEIQLLVATQGMRDVIASEAKQSQEEIAASPSAPRNDEPEIDIEVLQEEIRKISNRCESFGSVNLMAIDEFEDLKNRFEFLTKQQIDLLTAKDSLDQTIRKINRTTREMFMETFIKVNEQFRNHFRMVFNGGEAQLVLLDPDNALECGIDIIARPPGKKLQNINLLSGGEKTMTAIALIFAVFKVNPSPFCVLDEIDAALDEANVDRFAKVLKEFAKIAQFIVITHNKKTIGNANVMYGVTMQQTGISRVVSVKLSESGVEYDQYKTKKISKSQEESQSSDLPLELELEEPAFN